MRKNMKLIGLAVSLTCCAGFIDAQVLAHLCQHAGTVVTMRWHGCANMVAQT